MKRIVIPLSFSPSNPQAARVLAYIQQHSGANRSAFVIDCLDRFMSGQAVPPAPLFEDADSRADNGFVVDEALLDNL